MLSGVTLEKPITRNDLRFSVDASADSLGKKIRRAVDLKIPCVLVVGPKDAEGKTVAVRLKDKEETVKLAGLKEFLLGL